MARLVALTFVAVLCGQAHVGSPDIYLEAQAGPYKLFIAVRPPTAIPGAAQLEIRSETPGLHEIRAVPLPMSGPGAQFAPTPDILKISPQDRQFFTGTLWMMSSGSWQVKISASGERGSGTVAVPVPSVATSTKKMQAGLGALLSVLMSFLVFGFVAIVGASMREAKLPAGTTPTAALRTRGRVGMATAFVLVAGVLWYGNLWWNSEANDYSQNIYKPLNMKAAVHGNLLTLQLSEPGWLEAGDFEALTQTRTIDDLVPDHDHLMHLYLVREPALDVIYHLHPELKGAGIFKLDLPSMPAGAYKLYADIVHQSGFPETLVASLTLPGQPGRALTGDDASATAVPWNESPAVSASYTLPDGYHMEWVQPPGRLLSKRAMSFRFRLLTPDGRAPLDMTLYMGMLGHAAFLKTDGSVFAHIHPTGTVSMAAFMKAQGVSADSMPGMDMSASPASLPDQVSFPYGLPSPGRYRAFVQMKHGNTVETGVFDMQAY
jgi:hypothetical protein